MLVRVVRRPYVSIYKNIPTTLYLLTMRTDFSSRKLFLQVQLCGQNTNCNFMTDMLQEQKSVQLRLSYCGQYLPIVETTVTTNENAPEKSHLVDTVSLLRVLRANSESWATLNIKYLSSAMSTHVLLSEIGIKYNVT